MTENPDTVLAQIIEDADEIAEAALGNERTTAFLDALAERLVKMPDGEADRVLDAMAEVLAQALAKRAGRPWAEFQVKHRLVRMSRGR
jgi:hypothetical protein